jgi:PAS domain S-box-containing protein
MPEIRDPGTGAAAVGRGSHATVGVVLCDDMPELRELTRYGLEQDLRLQVLGEAGSAEECFGAVRDLAPDAILLDLTLPGMNGLEAIPELRQSSPELAIVILSGMDAARMEEPALARGADAYIEKGTSLSEIRRVVLAAARKHGVEVGPSAPRELRAPVPPAALQVTLDDPEDTRFQVLATHVPVGIFETDSAGRCTFANLRWSEIAGMALEDALGEGWIEAIHPQDRQRVVALWAPAVRTHTPVRTEFRFLRADGAISWAAVEAFPFATGRPGDPGFLGTVIETTALRDAEARASEAERELERLRRLAEPPT